MKCQRIMGILERLAPKRLAENWDNPGLQVGSPEQEVKKILICLDVSQQVVEMAVKKGADMIVSHHPVMIFKGLMNIRTDSYDGKMLQELLCHNIAVYSAHTNLDIARGGCNDILANLCGLERIEGFVPSEADESESMGRIGYVREPVGVEEYARVVCKNLGAGHVRLIKGGPELVRKVALCSGAGADLMGKAAFKGADMFITGDMKYHEAQQATKLGINVIDAGHFATEFPVVRGLAEYLRMETAKAKDQVEIIEDDVSQDFFQVINRGE